MAVITVNGYNYTILNKTTKKARGYMHDYRKNYGSLFNAYGRPSSAKIDAWNEICRRLTDVRITGAGTFQFSCAGKLVDKETGDVYFVIETPCYSYAVPGGWDYMYNK